MGQVDRMTHPLYSCGFSTRDRPTDTARWLGSGNALAGSSAQGLADGGGSADHPPCPHPQQCPVPPARPVRLDQQIAMARRTLHWRRPPPGNDPRFFWRAALGRWESAQMLGKLQHPDEQRQLQVNDKLITNRATAVEGQLRGTRRREVPLDVDQQLLGRADRHAAARFTSETSTPLATSLKNPLAGCGCGCGCGCGWSRNPIALALANRLAARQLGSSAAKGNCLRPSNCSTVERVNTGLFGMQLTGLFYGRTNAIGRRINGREA